MNNEIKNQMESETEEVIAILERANRAFNRIFGEQEAGEWEERTSLSHAEQMERFGWCVCEDTNGEGHLAQDCPQTGESDE